MTDLLVHNGVTYTAEWLRTSGSDDGPCYYCRHRYGGHRHVAIEDLEKVAEGQHVYCPECPDNVCRTPSAV